MKKVYFFLIFVVSALTVHAQAPESINYQAVARDASGNLIANQAVSFRLSILQGGSSGTMVYQETHAVTTNAFGMANLSIGTGIVTFGSFPIIDWGANTIWLKTELDPSGGSAYLLMGTSKFLSVPYALYSKSSGSSGNTIPAGTAGQTLRSDGNSWIADSTIYNDGYKIGIGTMNPDNSAVLDIHSTTKGFLPPRLTTPQRNTIESPAEGLVIYNLDEKSLNVYNGSSWAPVSPVVCGQPFTDTRNGKIYSTVLIGSQCWISQNLNIGTKIIDGENQTDNSIIEKYCYNNLESNCDIYGGLYQWAEIVQYINGSTNSTNFSPPPSGNIQGICPTGWHLPTDQEWSVLSSFLGGQAFAGGKLKEEGFIHWSSPNTGATNSTQFTCLPAGHRNYGPGFNNLGIATWLWCASGNTLDPNSAITRSLMYSTEDLSTQYAGKFWGFAVRCLKD